MGLADEDYAKALEEKRKRQVEEIQKIYQRQQMEKHMAGTVHISHGGTTTTFTGGGTTGASISKAFTEPMNSYVSEDDLKNEAMEAPLSAIVDMWTVRWGGMWVKETDLAEDHFWRIALMRLMGANKLERHNVVSSYSRVYRIIE